MDSGTRITFKNDKNQNIAGWLHGDNKKQVVIQVHGYPSDCHGNHEVYAQEFAKNGLSALRFDARGCGESEGEFKECMVSTVTQDVLAAIDWAKKECFEELFLMGSSFGGPVCIFASLEHPEIKKMVLRAPAPDMADQSTWGKPAIVNDWQSTGTLLYPKHDGSRLHIPYDFLLDCQKTIAYEPAKRVMAKTLILHGNKDTVVPLKQSQKLATNMPHVLLIILDGADHSLGIDGDLSESNRLMVEWFLEE